MSSSKTTFRDAYGVLQRHAQTLRDQSEPNIDDLLTIVNQSVAAYKVCQERIQAVEKALEKALGEPLAAPGTEPAVPAGARMPAGPAVDERWQADPEPDFSADDPPF